jgi:hypothetical protein
MRDPLRPGRLEHLLDRTDQPRAMFLVLVGQPCHLPVFLALAGSELTGLSIRSKSGTAPSSFEIATLLPRVCCFVSHSATSSLSPDHVLSHSRSFDHRLRARASLTAIAGALRCPTSAPRRLPHVTAVYPSDSAVSSNETLLARLFLVDDLLRMRRLAGPGDDYDGEIGAAMAQQRLAQLPCTPGMEDMLPPMLLNQLRDHHHD